MSPSIYSSLGNRFASNKVNLWFISIASVLAIIITIVASETISEFIPHQVPFGIALLSMVVAWGILIAVYWYGPEGKLETNRFERYEGVKMLFNRFLSWYGAIFLTIWFLSGIFVVPWLLVMQVLG